MSFRPFPDPDAERTPLLPFDPEAMDRSGLRLTRAEFARFMGVSKQSCSEWVRAGKIQLGPDGRLDPRKAVAQLLRNSDPTKLRARVLAPLVAEVDALRRRNAELEDRARAADEAADFAGGVADEVYAVHEAMLARLREAIRADVRITEAALVAWEAAAFSAAGDPGRAIWEFEPAGDPGEDLLPGEVHEPAPALESSMEGAGLYSLPEQPLTGDENAS